MKTLHRKLLRDLGQMWGQAVAIGLVIACGVAVFVMSLNTLQSLRQTQASYYERYRFADVFSPLKRAPLSVAARVAEIPGVSVVEARIVSEVSLEVAGLNEPAIGRLISLPELRPPNLNVVHLRRGRLPEPGRSHEVLVSEAFAVAHGLQPGDSLRAILNGRRQQLQIVGVSLSPEYIFQIRPGDLMPDDLRFGVFWINYRGLAAAFDMEGAFNDISLRLSPDASEEEVIRRLDLLLEAYGGSGAHGRDDQISHRFLSDEINQLAAMAVVAPIIFLGVAAFLLHTVMSRLIGTQREQIAMLKAFGYSRREVAGHYLKLVLIIAAAASIAGMLIGAWLGHGMTELYTRFFRFPEFAFHPEPWVFVPAFLISLTAAALGAYGAVRRAGALPPAEAMRPEPPANYRPTFIERVGLQRFFSQSIRMILRRVERQPLRAALSSFGIALAVAVLILGFFIKDSVEVVMDHQFAAIQRQDVRVTFVEPVERRALHEVAHLPDVMQAEPFRVAAARIRSGHRSRLVAIQGPETAGELFRVLHTDGRRATLPAEGILLSEALAEALEVRQGETVSVEILEGKRARRDLVVREIVTEYAGMNAYMELRALNRLLREGPLISGAFLQTRVDDRESFFTAVQNTPGISRISLTQAALDSFQEVLDENVLRMRFFNILFASVIAFGVVYNSARIALAERSHELATLRVIGFTRAEISLILLGEIAVLTLAAIPLGFLLGYGFAALMVYALETEQMQFPLVINLSTYAFALSVILIATAISALVVRRRIDHLDLVAVLKARE